jgi:curli biogenesis system outer membrane secretion channel CsgG
MRWLPRASLLFALALVACVGAKVTSDVWLSPDLQTYKPRVYAVLPFDVTPRIANDKAVWSAEAGQVASDAFETAFLKTGSRVVERGRLEPIFGELHFSKTGLTEANGIEIGKLLNADAVVLGMVTAYDQGTFGDATTVAFSVKAIHVQSGALLWKGNGSQVEGADKERDPSITVTEVAARLVEALLKKGYL